MDAGISLGRGIYSARLAAKLAGVSLRRLTYWTSRGLLRPSAFDAPRGGHDLYTYEDLVQARVIAKLRTDRAPLQRIRRAVEYLRTALPADEAWHRKKLVTDGSDIFALLEPGKTYSTVRRPGNRVFEVMLGEAADEIRDLGQSLGLGDTIEIDPAIQGGTPVVRSTRIPTRLVSELLGEGVTPRQIEQMYPGVTAARASAAGEFERQLAAV